MLYVFRVSCKNKKVIYVQHYLIIKVVKQYLCNIYIYIHDINIGKAKIFQTSFNNSNKELKNA
jgi:hypothetical protein